MFYTGSKINFCLSQYGRTNMQLYRTNLKLDRLPFLFKHKGIQNFLKLQLHPIQLQVCPVCCFILQIILCIIKTLKTETMKNLKTVFVLGMVFLIANSFAQSTGLGSGKTTNNKNAVYTYLDLMLNGVGTNINYGGANSELADYKESVKGIQAGLSFQAGITPAFSLVSELYYIRKGGKLKANNPLTIYESSLRLNTLELPVLARFRVGKFYMNAGPSIAYNLSGKRKIEDVSSELSFTNSPEGFKRFDAGIQLGGGFAFPLKQKRIALDIRYVYGLTNICYGQEMHDRAVMVSVNFSKAWKTNPLGKR